MLAVVKTPLTDIRIKGYVPPALLSYLRKEYGKKLQLEKSEDDEYVDAFSTPEYKAFKKRMTPGRYIRLYREVNEWSQQELGNKLGHSRAYICDLEKDRRSVSKGIAKKLAKLFGTSVERFI